VLVLVEYSYHLGYLGLCADRISSCQAYGRGDNRRRRRSLLAFCAFRPLRADSPSSFMRVSSSTHSSTHEGNTMCLCLGLQCGRSVSGASNSRRLQDDSARRERHDTTRHDTTRVVGFVSHMIGRVSPSQYDDMVKQHRSHERKDTTHFAVFRTSSPYRPESSSSMTMCVSFGWCMSSTILPPFSRRSFWA
jgi:hypothetical protein